MTTPLYVTAGQSNGVRIERYEGFEEYAEREGIDAAFLHTSVGGTGLAPLENRPDWYPLDDAGPNAGELYGAMLDEINALLETGAYHLAGIFWLQDGADATPALSLPYEERFQALVDSLIVEFGTEFTFTIAEASEVTPRYLNLLQTEGEDAAAKVAALEAIQAAQVSVAAAT
ncbi:MAG: sialate O-acetylesterase, partial [Pseudomonadota bacterium]